MHNMYMYIYVYRYVNICIHVGGQCLTWLMMGAYFIVNPPRIHRRSGPLRSGSLVRSGYEAPRFASGLRPVRVYEAVRSGTKRVRSAVRSGYEAQYEAGTKLRFVPVRSFASYQTNEASYQTNQLLRDEPDEPVRKKLSWPHLYNFAKKVELLASTLCS